MEVFENFGGGDKIVRLIEGPRVGVEEGVVQGHRMAGFFHHDR